MKKISVVNREAIEVLLLAFLIEIVPVIAGLMFLTVKGPRIVSGFSGLLLTLILFAVFFGDFIV